MFYPSSPGGAYAGRLEVLLVVRLVQGQFGGLRPHAGQRRVDKALLEAAELVTAAGKVLVIRRSRRSSAIYGTTGIRKGKAIERGPAVSTGVGPGWALRCTHSGAAAGEQLAVLQGQVEQCGRYGRHPR
jgi:hypothetical protein